MAHHRGELTFEGNREVAALKCGCGWHVAVLVLDYPGHGRCLDAAWAWHIRSVEQRLTAETIRARMRHYRATRPDHFPPWASEFRWGQAAHDEDGCNPSCSPPIHATLAYRYDRLVGWWPAADLRTELQVTTDWFAAELAVTAPAIIASVVRADDPPANGEWTPYVARWTRLEK